MIDGQYVILDDFNPNIMAELLTASTKWAISTLTKKLEEKDKEIENLKEIIKFIEQCM